MLCQCKDFGKKLIVTKLPQVIASGTVTIIVTGTINFTTGNSLKKQRRY